ncbi:MAG: dicarboxylate transporter/tellurite-resistance protein TehA [Betaproteobacteria bacterium]
MTQESKHIPVSFFGMAVGVLAWGHAWRVATEVWPLPPVLAWGAAVSGLLIWLAVLFAYGLKWWRARQSARLELDHPVQSAMAALGPVSTMLAAITLLPLVPQLAWALLGLALCAQLLLGLWLVGRIWQGGRSPETLNASVYLPAVAQNFVAATASATLGWTTVGALFFGAGVFSWLALQPLVLSRAATLAPVMPAQRPLQGIELAPSVVGGLSYLALTSGPPDLLAKMLLGYGLYQGLLALRLLAWTRQAGFAPTYWAFSFGVMALATMALRFLDRAPQELIWQWLAPILFAGANLVMALLLWHTTALARQGRLLPSAAAPAASGPGSQPS